MLFLCMTTHVDCLGPWKTSLQLKQRLNNMHLEQSSKEDMSGDRLCKKSQSYLVQLIGDGLTLTGFGDGNGLPLAKLKRHAMN